MSWLVYSYLVAVCTELSRGLQGSSSLQKKHFYGGFIKVIIKEGVRAKKRSSMPILEIQLVETKQSSQYDTHIHMRVVCEACKQNHVYTEHTVLYH